MFSRANIVVTDHALARFRLRADGMSHATMRPLINALLRSTSIPDNDPSMPRTARKRDHGYFFDRITQLLLCVKVEGDKHKIITCWRIGDDIPRDAKERAEKIRYGEDFIAWWSTAQIPERSSVTKEIASRAFAAGVIHAKGLSPLEATT